MCEDSKDWRDLDRRIRATLERSREHLQSETIRFTEQQLAHDEYETAFEGLCLALTTLSDEAKAAVDWTECVQLAKALGLDRESVLDDDFWSKLLTFSGFSRPDPS